MPAFRKPKGRNAAETLLLLGGVAITMSLAVITLANLMDVRIAENPADRPAAARRRPRWATATTRTR